MRRNAEQVVKDGRADPPAHAWKTRFGHLRGIQAGQDTIEQPAFDEEGEPIFPTTEAYFEKGPFWTPGLLTGIWY